MDRKDEELEALRAQLAKSAVAMEEASTLRADVEDLRRAAEHERESAERAASEARQEADVIRQLRCVYFSSITGRACLIRSVCFFISINSMGIVEIHMISYHKFHLIAGRACFIHSACVAISINSRNCRDTCPEFRNSRWYRPYDLLVSFVKGLWEGWIHICTCVCDNDV